MKNVHVSKHPLVMDKIARLRDKKTSVTDFRRLMGEVSMFLAHDALLHAKVKSAKVRTPIGVANVMKLSHDIVFVAILRAGLGMVDGLLKVHPEAKMAHIGIYRDEETLKPVKYYARLPQNVAGSCGDNEKPGREEYLLYLHAGGERRPEAAFSRPPGDAHLRRDRGREIEQQRLHRARPGRRRRQDVRHQLSRPDR